MPTVLTRETTVPLHGAAFLVGGCLILAGSLRWTGKHEPRGVVKRQDCGSLRMKTTRAFLVGLTSVALLGVPGLALASTPVASTPVESTGSILSPALASAPPLVLNRHRTTVRFLDFPHMRASWYPVNVRGQVTGWAQGRHGALPAVQVKLYRQLDGNSRWAYLATTSTGTGAYPQFSFPVLARQNAHYRVRFAGNASFQPSQNMTWQSVFRLFHGVITDGTTAATLHGRVTPYYGSKPIALQKRSCATCDYVTVKRARTGSTGEYSFALPAPASGRWWWRLAVPGTVAFVPSYGGTFSTQPR